MARSGWPGGWPVRREGAVERDARGIEADGAVADDAGADRCFGFPMMMDNGTVLDLHDEVMHDGGQAEIVVEPGGAIPPLR